MKNLILIFSLVFVLLGCTKEEPSINAFGTWRLVDAHLYIKRWGNYPLEKYDYFTDKQIENCVDINGDCFNLDVIRKNVTKWEIDPSPERFVLDDSVVYETQLGASTMRVFPTENGSCRIYIIDSIETGFIRWMTSEREQALTFKGVRDNYTYYSKLDFVRIK